MTSPVAGQPGDLGLVPLVGAGHEEAGRRGGGVAPEHRAQGLQEHALAVAARTDGERQHVLAHDADGRVADQPAYVTDQLGVVAEGVGQKPQPRAGVGLDVGRACGDAGVQAIGRGRRQPAGAQVDHPGRGVQRPRVCVEVAEADGRTGPEQVNDGPQLTMHEVVSGSVTRAASSFADVGGRDGAIISVAGAPPRFLAGLSTPRPTPIGCHLPQVG
jgi:hypothetical protein